jgi:NADPH2:quinone reductase
MKIVSFYKPLPITDPNSFIDLTSEQPCPGPRDLLVEVQAISVNPVDTKIRSGGGPGRPDGQLQILGWDAAGVVKERGPEVKLFEVGEEVYYAGSVDRPGSYGQFQCVDERIVGRKPKAIGFAEAAALPLTTITAWEVLFDRLGIPKGSKGSLLILGAAGGVGSIAIQLVRELTDLTTIATASRPESEAWCYRMGATHVVNHGKPLSSQVRAIVPAGVNYVLALTHTEDHFDELIEAMAPQSAIGLIENPARALEITKLKPKSISFHWEFMFTRSRYQTLDMGEQGRLLNEVGALVDAGRIQTTVQANLGAINAANLKKAHALIESGKTIGKIVLAGY